MACKFYFEGEDKISCNRHEDMVLHFLADGHGGDFISSFLKNNFFVIFKKNLGLLKDVQKAIKQTIREVDDRFKSESEGSTLVGFVLQSGRLTVFNVGDSRCYGITPQRKIVQLTEDHNLFNKAEIRRLKFDVEKHRGERRLGGVLAMTRSIGDNDVKGKISTPQIKTLNAKDYSHIILASDGMYESVDAESLLGIIWSSASLTKALARVRERAEASDVDDDKSILIKTL